MGRKRKSENTDRTARSPPPGEPMSPKIIVSYDGTANEDDAVTFGRLLGQAGASLALASVRQIVAIGAGDGGARDTAASIAHAVGGTVAPVVNDDADLLVIDSRPEAGPGRVSLSASASHLVETAICPVLVLPRGVALSFGR